jgi:hypothetical protein
VRGAVGGAARATHGRGAAARARGADGVHGPGCGDGR